MMDHCIYLQDTAVSSESTCSPLRKISLYHNVSVLSAKARTVRARVLQRLLGWMSVHETRTKTKEKEKKPIRRNHGSSSFNDHIL